MKDRSHPFTQPSPYGSVFHLVGRSASRWFGLRVFTRFTPFYTRPSSIAAQPTPGPVSRPVPVCDAKG